jgi:hypothetical protein
MPGSALLGQVADARGADDLAALEHLGRILGRRELVGDELRVLPALQDADLQQARHRPREGVDVGEGR